MQTVQCVLALRYVGLFHLGFFFSVDILKIDVDMSFSLGYRDMATIATNDDPYIRTMSGINEWGKASFINTSCMVE